MRASLCLLLIVCAGCSGSLTVDPRDLSTSAVNGIWTSTEAIGTLGQLELTLERRGETRVYDAVLEGSGAPVLGSSEGFGTLADRHLILDFGTGREDEYYYEAQVTDDGTNITGLVGQLVFPGQTETLAVDFTYSGPLPAAP